jgi:hypothetical protein
VPIELIAMLTFRSLLLTLIKLVLLTSCASTTGIFGDFIWEKKSLSYVHDRRAKSDSTLAYLCVAKPRVSYWQMRCSGSVQQIHASSMPLIIFNTWKAEYLYMLGTAGVAEDVSAFVQDAILQESKINSSFKGIKIKQEISSSWK